MSYQEVTQADASQQAVVDAPTQVGKIGRVLLESGRLTEKQAEKVLLRQQERKIRFGEAAIELGYITEADIQFALARQFSYAYLQPGDGLVSEQVVAAYYPYTPYVERLRSLRSQLNQSWIQKGRKALVLVSDEAGSGCTELAANLAVVFAQLGERTLLIDADLRDSQQHLLFKLTNRQGLTDILADRADIGCIHKINRLPGLSVLTSGTPAPNPQELLARPQFKLLLDELEQRFDVIIIDSPALEGCVDAQVIAAPVQGVVMVANQHETKAKALQDAVSLIRNTGAQILGCVLNQQ